MSKSNAHQYQPVPQIVESDSEDDQVALYTSPKLNKDGHFGLGRYDQSKDLELPPVFKVKRQSANTISRCQTVCTVSIVAIVLAIVLAIAITMIVFGQMVSHRSQSIDTTCIPRSTPLFRVTSIQSVDTSCTPIPTPLLTVHVVTTTEMPSDGSDTRHLTTSKEVEEPTTHLQATSSEPTPNTNYVSSVQTIEPTQTFTESNKASEDDITSPTLKTNPTSNNIPEVNSETPTQTDDVSTMPSTPEPPPILSTLPSSDSPFYWEREFFPSTTESSIQISDMNRDGIPDVITAQAYGQCGVKVIAMDGNSGDTIWEVDAKFEAFAIRCEFDVNRDGIDDCILAGRFGGFAAINGINGSILWEVDKSIVYPRYNFYFPLIVKDMDGDGVEELINIHSGDQTYNAEDINRSPGFLVVVSGTTGQSLMDPILLPDGHESYMSPILFKMNEKFDLIIFGTGGETIPGSLWAISMSSIKKRVLRKIKFRKLNQETYYPFKNDTYHSCYLQSNLLDAMRPKFDNTVVDFTRPYLTSRLEAFCPKWSNIVPIFNTYGVCLYKLMGSTTKGIMLPPVIVDLDKDGVKDLVVSTFDGHTIALNGSDLVTRLWDVYYPNTETYSIPAPIFYTDDSIPDILIRTSLGEWSTYNSSTIRLLNGSDGVELWNFSSAHTSMMSPLTVSSYSPGLDAMLFIAVGSISDSTSSTSDSNFNDSLVNSTPDFNSSSSVNESVPTRERNVRVKHHSHNSDPKLNDLAGVDTHINGDGDDGGQNMFDDLGEAREDEDDDDDDEPHNGLDYADDFIQRAMNIQDPPELWISTPDDPFPDPETDIEGFIEYCGESVERLTGYVWFITKEMIEGGVELKPLAKHDPHIHFLSNSSQSSLIFKRHGNSPEDASELSRKTVRCGHIVAPIMSFTTPALGDFNQDGHLDVAYSIVWGPLGGMMLVPPKFKVFVFTLEERFREVYGSDVVVDFNGFLPSNEQPWSRYMGTMGDNVYRSN